jgi:hypothetical protein
VNAPNVQLAEQPEHVDALARRHDAAVAAAKKRGCDAERQALHDAGACSQAVVALSAALARDLLDRDDVLYSNYDRRVAAGTLASTRPEWDRERVVSDGLIYGRWGREVVFAALSCDGRGLDSYGEVHLELHEPAVSHRATVLEENAMVFARAHALTGDKPLPAGHLARWSDRGRLAVCKLHGHLKRGCTLPVCQGMLQTRAKARDDERCIEVHIFGTFNRQAVRHIAAPRPRRSVLTAQRLAALTLRILEERAPTLGIDWSTH